MLSQLTVPIAPHYSMPCDTAEVSAHTEWPSEALCVQHDAQAVYSVASLYLHCHEGCMFLAVAGLRAKNIVRAWVGSSTAFILFPSICSAPSSAAAALIS